METGKQTQQEQPDTPAEGEQQSQSGNTPAEAFSEAAQQAPSQAAETPSGDTSGDERQKEIDRLTRTVKQLEGRLKAGSDNTRVESELRALRREIRRRDIERDENLSDDQRRQSLSQLQDEEQQDAESVRVQSYMQRLASRLDRRLDRSGIEMDHPEVQKALEKWRQARTIDDADDVYDALDDFIDRETEARRKKEADEARKQRQRTNQERGTLAVGAEGGNSTGSTEQDWLDRWADEASGGIPPTPENAEYAKKLWAKGLRPRART